jgi:hypothetical protein
MPSFVHYITTNVKFLMSKVANLPTLFLSGALAVTHVAIKFLFMTSYIANVILSRQSLFHIQIIEDKCSTQQLRHH